MSKFLWRIVFACLSCGGVLQAHASLTVMVFGDSISAGYGLPQGTGWVDLLSKRLNSRGGDYRVINASVSGETTTGGRNRIAAALERHKPGIVILELGANDGLRGTRVDTIKANLSAMIAECRKGGARVLLVGMQMPPNYGVAYAEKFRQMYLQVAREERIALAPFIYEGFAANREAFQADGIHPNVSVQERMLDNVWKVLVGLLPDRKPARKK